MDRCVSWNCLILLFVSPLWKWMLALIIWSYSSSCWLGMFAQWQYSSKVLSKFSSKVGLDERELNWINESILLLLLIHSYLILMLDLILQMVSIIIIRWAAKFLLDLVMWWPIHTRIDGCLPASLRELLFICFFLPVFHCLCCLDLESSPLTLLKVKLISIKTISLGKN